MGAQRWRYGLLAGLVAIACTIGFPPFLSLLAPQLSPPAKGSELLVAAAASLQNPLQEITTLESVDAPKMTVRYTFAPSGALQRQIEQGAPIDVFISAAQKPMQLLQKQGLVLPETQTELLTNQLVLIVPKIADSNITSFQDLLKPTIQRLAIGEPRSVPAGQYAIEVLQNLGILDQLQSKLVLSNNVKAVLTAVETGNVDAGIVYLTDAQGSNQVIVTCTADPELHSPIIYPVAVLRSSQSIPQAKQYLKFLKGELAQAVFKRYGFGVPAA
ncbi:molybdate ABC transporter substrate-binding protein [Synechococcus elongatus]|uniref:molybdate ABC transporter substrate-binding protein n=1 Tax=Synechococcus elongatus TaxID=32046 RepID=UPI000F7EDE40|nr:molybdate ABC transporter substrate-binding protein [Synechococcus elongatus]